MLKSLNGNGLASAVTLMVAVALTVLSMNRSTMAETSAGKDARAHQAAAIDPSGEQGAPSASAASAASATRSIAAQTAAQTAAQKVAAESSPRPAIEAFHAALLEIMKSAKELGFQGRIDRLSPLMAETFDLDFMASKTVGSHWRKLSDADKQRWATVFARMTTANYAGRFTGYTGESFVTVGEEPAARDTRMVLTKIVLPEDEDVQINYRVRFKDGAWKVIDVYLNGTVSELALRRSEYSSALKREGFDELVASVETKIEDLKAKGLVDG